MRRNLGIHNFYLQEQIGTNKQNNFVDDKNAGDVSYKSVDKNTSVADLIRFHACREWTTMVAVSQEETCYNSGKVGLALQVLEEENVACRSSKTVASERTSKTIF